MIRRILLFAGVGCLLAGGWAWREVHTPSRMNVPEALAAAERGESAYVRIEVFDGSKGLVQPLRRLHTDSPRSLDAIPRDQWQELRGARVRIRGHALGAGRMMTRVTRADESQMDPKPEPYKHAMLLVPLQAKVWATSPERSWPASVRTITEELGQKLSPDTPQTEWARRGEFEGTLLRFDDLQREEWAFDLGRWEQPSWPAPDDWMLDAGKATRKVAHDVGVYFGIAEAPGRLWLTEAQAEDDFFKIPGERTQFTGILRPRGAEGLAPPPSRNEVQFALLVVASEDVAATLRETWFQHWGLKAVVAGGLLLLAVAVLSFRARRAY